jgi:integrase
MPKLTVPTIRKYKPAAHRREIPDATPSLYLIIQPKPKGSMSWAVRFRRPDGRAAKLTLGPAHIPAKKEKAESADEPVLGGALTLGQARDLANKIGRQRAMGIDVIEERKAAKERQRVETDTRSANSFGAAVREFFVEHKVKKWKTRPRRWRGDARLLGLRWPPGSDPATVKPEVIKGGLADTWRKKSVADIDRADIITIVADVLKNGVPGLKRRNDGKSKNRARKMHSALSVFCRWLAKENRIARNPCAGLEPPEPPKDRERFLADDELGPFWRACDQIGAPYGPLFQILLLTGARLAEVSGMRRDELGSVILVRNNGTGTKKIKEQIPAWTIPSERSKNHLPHLVPLPPLVQEIIGRVPAIEGSQFVFTASGLAPVSGWSKAKAKLDAAMTQQAGEPVQPFRLHDLRRSCATGLGDLGIEPHIVEAVLNHISGSRRGPAGTYNKAVYLAEKRVALARWADHVEKLVAGKSATLLPMRRKGSAK